MFDSFYALLRISLGAVAAYAALIVLLRVAGKRSLSKLNAFDFVITIAIGSTFASFVLSKDVTFADGLVALILLVGLQYALTWASAQSRPSSGWCAQNRGCCCATGRSTKALCGSSG